MNRIFIAFLSLSFFCLHLPKVQAQCEITDIEAFAQPCVAGEFYVWLNFNPSNSPGGTFSLTVNGEDLGDFSYQELPFEFGPYMADNVTSLAINVSDNDFTNCQAEAIIDPVLCGISDCDVYDFAVAPSDCNGDNQYDLYLNFAYNDPVDDFFEVFYDGNLYGTYELTQLPLTIENFADNGEPVPAVTICVNDIPECCYTAEFDSPLCGVCQIQNFELLDIDCVTGDFWAVFDFDPVNVGDNGFSVVVNNNVFSTYSYDDHNFTVGPLPADGTFYNVTVQDVDSPDCASTIELGETDCGANTDCEIWDVEITDVSCENGQFIAALNFNHANTGSAGFTVQGNGMDYGSFLYQNLPVTLGPLPADGTFYEFVVRDETNPDCSNFIDYGVVDCDCAISNLTLDATECFEPTNSYNLIIDFDYEGASNEFFDLIYNGETIGFYALADLPLTLTNFADNGEFSPYITVCINDTPNCCLGGEFISPCGNNSDCSITGIYAEAHPCDDNGQFLVDLEFELDGVGSDGFFIVANDHEYGPFAYGETFYTFGPLESGVFYEISVIDVANQNCSAYYGFEPNYCGEDCHIYDLTAEATECDDLGQFFVLLDFEHTNTGADGFQVVGNGNFYGTFGYDGLPLELGPFTESDLQLEFIVSDVQQPDCGDFIGLEAPDCGGNGGCQISNLTVNETPCSSNGTFYAIIDFEHENTSGIAFSVHGNGIGYGFYSYDELPVSIGPLVGNGTTPYEFVVNDILQMDCGDSFGLGPVDCNITGDCAITDFIADASDCNSDNTFDLWLNFDYENATNLYFDVIYQGEIVDYFPLGSLPVILPHFVGNGALEQEITVCINDTPGCCATFTFAAPDCQGPNLIYPGDTDADNYASHFDLLNIGLAYGAEGPARSVQGIEWTGISAEQWGQYFSNGLDYVHTDCDGNGLIDEADIQAIQVNFGESHNEITPSILLGGTPDDPPFYVDMINAGDLIDGQPFSASIILGSEDVPVDDLYGIAFTLNFDPQVIDPSSIELKYDPSWLGVENVNLITFDRTEAASGKVHVALSRTDQSDVSGHGHIAEFIGIIDNIAGKNEMRIDITDVKAIQETAALIPVHRPDNVAGLVTSGTNEWVRSEFEIYPNPAKTEITLRHPDNLRIENIEVKNVDGKTFEVKISGDNSLNISHLPEGVYFLKIETAVGLHLEKLVVF